MKPKVCILRSDGANCDEELFYAFEKYGGIPDLVHVNELRIKTKRLKSYQILAIPGGFSYGDDIAAGKILAVELISFLKNELESFIGKRGLMLGVCNGFQTLVRTGLLPFGHLGKMEATLVQNQSGHFECRWIKIKIEKSKAIFLKLYEGQIMDVAVNHGEGKFLSDQATITKIEKEDLVFCRYVDDSANPTQKYPANPNGALNAIAGITDPTGRILGLMPHPEKIVDESQHPNWRREKINAHGGIIFKSMIQFARQS